jgi:hypothetical protein
VLSYPPLSTWAWLTSMCFVCAALILCDGDAEVSLPRRGVCCLSSPPPPPLLLFALNLLCRLAAVADALLGMVNFDLLLLLLLLLPGAALTASSDDFHSSNATCACHQVRRWPDQILCEVVE